MNVLIIFAHPNKESFCSAIKNTLFESLKANKNDIRVHDLYNDKFNPKLSKIELTGESKKISDFKLVKNYQADIKWANTIIIIHPAWWYGAPAILKGYFDRVLSEGFAFIYKDDEPEPKLTGKNGILIQTFDATEEMEKKLFNEITYKSIFYTWKYCGVVDWVYKAFFRVNFVTHEQRTSWLQEIVNIGKNIN